MVPTILGGGDVWRVGRHGFVSNPCRCVGGRKTPPSYPSLMGIRVVIKERASAIAPRLLWIRGIVFLLKLINVPASSHPSGQTRTRPRFEQKVLHPRYLQGFHLSILGLGERQSHQFAV